MGRGRHHARGWQGWASRQQIGVRAGIPEGLGVTGAVGGDERKIEQASSHRAAWAHLDISLRNRAGTECISEMLLRRGTCEGEGRLPRRR